MRRAAIAVALTFALFTVLGAATLALAVYRVHGPSMEPALTEGDLVLTNPLQRSPARFDAVVYLPTDGNPAVKRVIALPGDRIRIERDGPRVQVGGQGPWLQVITARPWPGGGTCCGSDGRVSPAPSDALVPDGSYFLLGDNPTVSTDSRSHGTVSADRLRGTVLFPSTSGALSLVTAVAACCGVNP